MDNENRLEHWERIYQTKSPEEVSWTQKTPTTSLEYISSLGLDMNVKIIDIGGGDSTLVDHLLDLGYQNLTVLDISIEALKRAQKRLGDKAKLINWVHSDIIDFRPKEDYDVWHDRAAFHFLTTKNEIDNYIRIAENTVKKHMIIGTFSNNGPIKCSGLEIKQYDKKSLEMTFNKSFKITNSNTEDHITPFDTKQNFVFGLFEKR